MFGLRIVVAALRSFVVYVVVSLYVVLTAPPGILIALLVRRPDLLYWLARQGVRLALATVGISYRVTGAEHIQRSRPTVYCVNHVSNLEPPVLYMALAAVHPRLRVLYKAEIHRVPLLSTVFDVAGFVPIQRRSREQSRLAIETATQALRAGNVKGGGGGSIPWIPSVRARKSRAVAAKAASCLGVAAGAAVPPKRKSGRLVPRVVIVCHRAP